MATIPGSSIAVLDGSVVSVALPSIERDLGGGLASRQWISGAYLLTLGSLILLDDLAADGIPVLIAPDAANRKGDLPAGKADATRGCDTCSRPISAAAYTAAARWLIDAVFEQTKHNRGMRQFRRRGRSAVRSELLLIAATHNLVKLHKQQLTLAAA